MTGEALTVIGRLDPTAALNYDQLRAALLQRFRYTAEGYREKFRQAKPDDNESGLQFAARLPGSFDHWLEMGKTEKSYSSLRELIISEQFMKGCSPALRIFLKERNCKTLSSLCETADSFMEAQALSNLSKERIPKETGPSASKSEPARKTEKTTSRCFLCDKKGHRAADCWSRTRRGFPVHDRNDTLPRSRDKSPTGRVDKKEASCMVSVDKTDASSTGNEGYVVLQDGQKIPVVNTTVGRGVTAGGNGNLPVAKGFLENSPVRVLRDTGCNTVVVRQALVPKEKFTGTTSPVYLLDHSVRYLPEAKVFLRSPFFVGEALVKCMEDPMYDAILGNIKGAALPDTLPLNESQLHFNAHMKIEQGQRSNCMKDDRDNGAQRVSGDRTATQAKPEELLQDDGLKTIAEP